MASTAQLEAALVKADAAGDTDGARVLAQAIRAERAKVGGAGSGAAGGRALDSAIPATFGETAVDMARVVPGGLAKGASYALGMGGDATSMLSDATGIDRNKIRAGIMAASPLLNAVLPPGVTQAMAGPTSADYSAALSAPTGGYYKPQTEGGRHVERGAEFAAGAAIPGSIVGRLARVAVPGALSRFGEDELGPYGGVIGALAGGVATAPRALTSISQLARGVPRAERVLLNAAQNSWGGKAGAEAALRAHEEVGVPATFIDVGGYGAGRAYRAAAGGPKGPAQDMAIAHRDRVVGDFQEGVSEQASRLTPGEPRSATDYISGVRRQRQAQADIDYPPGDAARVRLTDTQLSAMSGKPGRDALAEAAAIAEARQDTATTSELNRILEALQPENGGRFPPTISGRALEYVRQSMSEASRTAFRAERGGYGGGLRSRTGQLDTVLDEHFAEPRRNYHNYSNQIRAAELGQKSTLPSSGSYASDLARIAERTPQARASAGIGRRDAIQNVIDNTVEGTSGSLNRIVNTPAQRRANVATFGAERAGKFQNAVRLWIDRQRRAQRFAPGAGSDTEPKIAEQTLISVVSGKLWEPIFDALRRGTQRLTPAQRAELVRLGSSEDEVRRLVNAIPDGMSTRQAVGVITALSANNTRNYEIAR